MAYFFIQYIGSSHRRYGSFFQFIDLSHKRFGLFFFYSFVHLTEIMGFSSIHLFISQKLFFFFINSLAHLTEVMLLFFNWLAHLKRHVGYDFGGNFPNIFSSFSFE